MAADSVAKKVAPSPLHDAASRAWIRREICDHEADLKSDSAEDLRAQIRALPRRPIQYRYWHSGDFQFVHTLELGTISELELKRMISRFMEGGPAGVCTQAMELSLLLRLIVALGVDLNMLFVEVHNFDVNGTAWKTTSYKDKTVRGVKIPLMFTCVSTNRITGDVSGLALLAAGRRLKLNYATCGVVDIPARRISAALLLTRIHTGSVVSVEEHMTRVGRVAGEEGVLFCCSGSPLSLVSNSNSSNFHVAIAPYLADDASPNLWPVHMYHAKSNPNERRHTYRAGLPRLVSEVLPIAPIAAIVLEFVWLPLKPQQ